MPAPSELPERVLRCDYCVGVRVEIVLYDGWDELDAIGPYEVLKNASAAVGDLFWSRDPGDDRLPVRERTARRQA
jgi:putative intracellular protease/amidase